ncbi:MAG: hypothetical protein LBB54_00910, partial [Cellulomonadaceae bacterium]|nr:hypothetical protein [Cellulomonadaceae bacterium]
MPTQYPTRASIHRTTTQATQASAPHATVRVIKAQPKFDHNPTASTASAHNQNHQAHLPTVNTVVEASRAAIQSAAPSRADRRRAQQVADQLIRDHRRSQRQRMAAGGSLLAAAAATLVTTTTVGPASHPAPADIEVADQATGDIEGAIRARTGSAGRSGNRVELSTLANGDLATPAEVLDTAAEVLARTSELTAVESRTTPDHLAEVLAARDDVL